MRAKKKEEKAVNYKKISSILRGKACPAFYFFTDIGCYTGKLADSLIDFRRKIKNLNINSIEFHCERGDFRRWIKDCVKDLELADRISKIPKKLKGEKLRREVYQVVDKRIKELKKMITSKER
ncbi:MAG: hypothetical protein ACOC6H_02800 [Thermoproteota archaeon]